MKKKNLITIVLLFGIMPLIAQKQFGGVPLSFTYNLPFDSVPIRTLTTISNQSLYDSIPAPTIDSIYIVYDSISSTYDTVFAVLPAKAAFCVRPVGSFLNTGHIDTLPNQAIVIRTMIISVCP
jgi:hypothetical protein